MPVAIDVTNHGAEVDGTLEIQASNSFGGKGGPPGGSAVYQLPLSLASGATKHLRTFLSEDYPGTVDARIIAQGRVLAESVAAESVYADPQAVTDRRTASKALASIKRAV